MDTTEYIENFLKELKGEKISLELVSEETKDTDGKSWWKAHGKLIGSVTRNGKDWGDVEFESVAYDVDSVTSFSVVLASCVNFIGSPDFHETLFDETMKAEQAETEEKNEGQD